MNRFLIVFSLTVLFSSASYARCGEETRFGADIFVDLSSHLSKSNRTHEVTVTSNFGLHTFYCSTTALFQYGFPMSDRSRVVAVGLNDGKDWIRVEVINPIGSRQLDPGNHIASELNAPINLFFTLLDYVPSGVKVNSSTARFGNVIIARDTSGMTFQEFIGSVFIFAGKFLKWVFSFFQEWPLDSRDLFTHGLTINYTPKMSTCIFNNAGLMVNLPKISVAQLTRNAQPGYTPFTLNFSCDNLQANGSTNRSIDMFLSSNNLLPSNNSVLMDSTPGSAKGVGIKVAKVDTPNTSVVFSTSTLNRGRATSIFSAAPGAVINSNFSVGMGAYYFPYNPAQLTSGEIKATATLNIVYQ